MNVEAAENMMEVFKLSVQVESLDEEVKAIES